MHLRWLSALCATTLPAAGAIPAELQAQASTCADACWSQIYTNRHATAVSARGGCSLQFRTTVVPCTVTSTSKATVTSTHTIGQLVATSTATITVPTTITRGVLAVETVNVTTSTVEWIYLTTSSAAATSTTTTTTVIEDLEQRALCTPQRIATTTVPAYFASCPNMAAYSSACSCFGVPHATVTAATPTVVVNATSVVNTRVTVTPTTTTVITHTVHKPTRIVRTTTSSTTVTQGAVATEICLDYNWYEPSVYNICPTLANGTVINYDGIGSSAGYLFNYSNPGNQDPNHPPIVNMLDGSLDNVDASTQCAAAASSYDPPYLSFEIAHLCEADQWRCTMFYGVNFDTSYWNVLDRDAGTEMFFSNGYWASQGLPSYPCGEVIPF